MISDLICHQLVPHFKAKQPASFSPAFRQKDSDGEAILHLLPKPRTSFG